LNYFNYLECEVMRKFIILSLLAASAAISATANAAVILVDASSIQGSVVLFNSGPQSGTTVTGSTQGGTIVNFTGLTVGGGNIIAANGGRRVSKAAVLLTSLA
jgi:hypothetical protein